MTPQNPWRDTVSGEFYFGSDCVHCGEFQYIVYDEDHGKIPTTMTGLPIKWRCENCRRFGLYLPASLVLRRAP